MSGCVGSEVLLSISMIAWWLRIRMGYLPGRMLDIETYFAL